MNIRDIVVLFLLSSIFIPVISTAAISPWSDLTVSEIAAPLVAYPGYPYALNVTVENHGNATSGLISVGFYLSEDNHLSPNDTFIQVTTGDLLPSGRATRLSSIDTLPAEIAPGTYRLFAYVEDHRGDEKDLSDNTALLSAPVSVRARAVPSDETIARKAARIIFDETNAARLQEGLSPLTWDDDLAAIAAAYSERMGRQKFFSHTDPDGHDQSYRAEAAGYQTIKEIEGGKRIGVSENIAYVGTGNVVSYGYVNPTNPSSIAGIIMDGWMKSPGHRNNIMDPLSDRIGVGLSYHDEYWYATQEFF